MVLDDILLLGERPTVGDILLLASAPETPQPQPGDLGTLTLSIQAVVRADGSIEGSISGELNLGD